MIFFKSTLLISACLAVVVQAEQIEPLVLSRDDARLRLLARDTCAVNCTESAQVHFFNDIV